MRDWGAKPLYRARERMRTRQRIQGKRVQGTEGIKTPRILGVMDSGADLDNKSLLRSKVAWRRKPTADLNAMRLFISLLIQHGFFNKHLLCTQGEPDLWGWGCDGGWL